MPRQAPPVPPAPSRRDETAVIVNMRPAMLIAPAIREKNRDGEMEEIYPRKTLAPGINHVPAGYVEELEDMDERGPGAVWAMWRTLGYVKLAKPEEAASMAEGVQSPASIADRNPVAVEAMVATETRTDVLQAWYATDRRKETRTAITARLKELSGQSEAPPVPK